MKGKAVLSSLCLILISFLMSCSRVIYIQSRPIGYSMISSDFVAKGSFTYDSQFPFNINEITMTLYLMPHLLGEINSEQAQIISDSDPNFVIIEESAELTTLKRAYVKHMMINQEIWTASIVEGHLVYKNVLDIDFISHMASEQHVKSYIEAVELNQVYFLNHEFVMLMGFQSIYDNGEVNFIIQQTYVANVNYALTNQEFPDLSLHFPEFDAAQVSSLFMRTYDHRDEIEYKTSEYKK